MLIMAMPSGGRSTGLSIRKQAAQIGQRSLVQGYLVSVISSNVPRQFFLASGGNRHCILVSIGGHCVKNRVLPNEPLLPRTSEEVVSIGAMSNMHAHTKAARSSGFVYCCNDCSDPHRC